MTIFPRKQIPDTIFFGAEQMPLSREARKQLLKLFRQDIENPLSYEEITRRSAELLEKDGFLMELMIEKIRRERAGEIVRSQEMWFQSLGWWFAKLFMWGALLAAVLGVLFFGRAAADPLTWSLSGCAVYYVLIQVLTPWRLAQQRRDIEKMSDNSRRKTQELLEHLEKE